MNTAQQNSILGPRSFGSIAQVSHMQNGRALGSRMEQARVVKCQHVQSRTQSSQAFWSADKHWERLWGTGILLPQEFCVKRIQAVMGQPIKKLYFFSNSPD